MILKLKNNLAACLSIGFIFALSGNASAGNSGSYLALDAAAGRYDALAAADYALKIPGEAQKISAVRFLLAARKFDEAAALAATLQPGAQASFFVRLAGVVRDWRQGKPLDALKYLPEPKAETKAQSGSKLPAGFGEADIFRNLLRSWVAIAAGQKEDHKFAGDLPVQRFAAALFHAQHKRYPEAEKLLLPLAAAETGASRRALLRLVDVRVAAGNRAGAESLLREALHTRDNPLLRKRLAHLDAGEPFTPQASAAETLLSMAAFYLRDRDFTASAAVTAAAAAIAPDMPSALYYSIETAAEGPPRAEVLDLYDRLFKDPVYGERAVLSKAERLYNAGRADAALVLIRSQASPDRPLLQVLEGDILRNRAQFTDAAAAYDRALRAASDFPKTDTARLYYLRGGAYERAGRWEQAEPDLREALRLNPDDADVLNYLGYALAERGSALDESLRLLEKALRLRPDEGYIVDSIGYAYLRSGNVGKALFYLERAVRLSPGDAEISEHLGDAYLAAGRPREALFAYNDAAAFTDNEVVQVRLSGKRIPLL